MLSLFTVVESELLMQAGLEKAQRGSTATVQNKVCSRSFSVRCCISLAYWEGIDFCGVSVYCVTPQAIRIFLCNRIGDSTGDVPCFSLGFGGTMCLILLTCSLFLPVYVTHFIVCSFVV